MVLIIDTFVIQELALLVLIFVIARLSIQSLIKQPYKNSSRPLPPGPKGWPIIGVLPLLGTIPHVTLAEFAKKYGPVMYLKMGTCDMVVASTPDAARAFLKTLDRNFSNRPPNAGSTYLAYDSQNMAFTNYGPRWKLLRRLSNLHMLGGKALADWANVRANEVGHMLRAMCDASDNNEPVVVSEMLAYAMANMIGQVILSRRIFVTKGSESNEFKDMVVELVTTAGYFNIGDFIPSIAWMDLQGIQKGMKNLHKKFDVLLTKMLDQHMSTTHLRKGKPDFLDVLLANAQSSDGENEKLTLTSIKALLLDLFTAGTDTSSSIIEWALSEMLENPSILKRAQEEMDQVIGKARRLEESDISKLPYLRAICKETLRKHPSTPLNLPRVSIEACEVNGYYIPKNTRLSVNIWAIGRDPNVWENPLEFNPERFMSEKYGKIEATGNDFELIPFGAGRRICAGNRMGIIVVEYILGTLLHSFDCKLPNRVLKLNMEETFGLTLQKKVPLSIMVRPRLLPNAY